MQKQSYELCEQMGLDTQYNFIYKYRQPRVL